MNIGKKISILILSIGLILLGMFYDAYYVAPSRYRIRYETLSSQTIPEQLNDVTILYFSDLDYNKFMNEKRLEKLCDRITSLSPDIIIFGGDMFDEDSPMPSTLVVKSIVDVFKNLKAPLGKFAVLGDVDHESTMMERKVKDILYKSDFEILENKSVLIRNQGSQAITLVGLDSEYKGHFNPNKAYNNVAGSAYTIAVCHTPDSSDRVPSDLTDYFLAGHSHGGQVNLGYKTLFTKPYGEKYQQGKHTIHNTFILDVTNGVGTTIEDVRFLANAEVVVYRLHHIP